MRTGVFAGSFDPPTKGHEDIIERASQLFDRVIVMVSPNSAKHGMFTTEQKMKWLQVMTEDLDNVEIALCDGLTIARARELGGTVLIRSMRNEGDYLSEANNAWLNASMKQGMDTLFLIGKPEHSLISSSNVRELLKYNQSIEFLVPACVFEDLQPQFVHQAD
ncbi:pantetheine-phosphate adenylyltransferase [Erysipelotrichaceae bacterium RD49]|nr:pantetheine-phosphate adenylyltransferase [Erysipelotrichaceae bacterium RD49]